MAEETKKETPPVVPPKTVKQPPRLRQVLIETDGSVIRVTRNETSGSIEFVGILQSLLSQFNRINK